MKAEDIINQLRLVLPQHTDLFSTTTNLTSITQAAGTATATTPTAHSLIVGNDVTITGATTPNIITSLTFFEGTVTAVTTAEHDLTNNDGQTVTIVGATETDYNGTFDLLDAPDRNTFTYTITGTPTSPATGSPTLQELLPLLTYNGRQTITATPTPTTFEFAVNTALPSPAGGVPVLQDSIRVSGSISAERAIAAYTPQDINDIWAFVVIGDSVFSRDRSQNNDAVSILQGPEAVRMTRIETMSVYVFIPSSNQIASRTARDQGEDIVKALYLSLVGFEVPTVFSDIRNWMLTPTGDGFFDTEKAFYIHRIDFETAQQVIKTDIFTPTIDVAFKQFNLATLNDFDEKLTDDQITLTP